LDWQSTNEDMKSLTIRNIPKATLARLKAVARQKNHSMEQEVRELLGKKYAPAPEIAARIRERWKELPKTTPTQVKIWQQIGRP
jgi:plasmid stability protein